MNTEKLPLVYTIDDDSDINALVKKWLEMLNCNVESFEDAKSFLTCLKLNTPDMCIIDINISGANSGLSIIQAIRSVIGFEIPLLVFSADSTERVIAHAMEIGANEYIQKGADRTTFNETVKKFLKVHQDLGNSSGKLRIVPASQNEAKLFVNIQIKSVSENGFTLISKCLLSKGTTLHLSGDLVNQIMGNKEPLFVSVISNWAEPERYGANVELVSSDPKIQDCLRNWLIEKCSQ